MYYEQQSILSRLSTGGMITVDQGKSRDQRPAGKRNTYLPSTEMLVHFDEVLVDILAVDNVMTPST